MPERKPSVERIKNDLLDLRRYGCVKHIGMCTDLLHAMGCQSASIEKKDFVRHHARSEAGL